MKFLKKSFKEFWLGDVLIVKSPLLIEEKIEKTLVHGFTTRFGGVSQGYLSSLNLDHKLDSVENVRRNHEILGSALRYKAEDMVSTNQVHTDVVRVARREDSGKHLDYAVDYECDALITNEKNLPLVAYSADCIPIILFDPVKEAVAVIHSGWRGTALAIVARAVEKMSAEYGCQPEHILAAIGAGIGECCFTTHRDVPDAFRQVLGIAYDDFIVDAADEGKFAVDLKGINKHWLVSAGVLAENVDVDMECTCCSGEKYWSHRATQGKRGGQGVVAMLK